VEPTAGFRCLAVGGLDTRIRVRDGGMRGREGLNDSWERPGFLRKFGLVAEIAQTPC